MAHSPMPGLGGHPADWLVGFLKRVKGKGKKYGGAEMAGIESAAVQQTFAIR